MPCLHPEQHASGCSFDEAGLGVTMSLGCHARIVPGSCTFNSKSRAQSHLTTKSPARQISQGKFLVKVWLKLRIDQGQCGTGEKRNLAET